jgi:hypothetical protein
VPSGLVTEWQGQDTTRTRGVMSVGDLTSQARARANSNRSGALSGHERKPGKVVTESGVLDN